MNNSDKQTGKLPSRDVGMYLEECGSIKDRIAGFEGQEASESMKFLNWSWSGALILRTGVGDFDALGVLDGEISGEGDGLDNGDGVDEEFDLYSRDFIIEALRFFPQNLISCTGAYGTIQSQWTAMILPLFSAITHGVRGFSLIFCE